MLSLRCFGQTQCIYACMLSMYACVCIYIYMHTHTHACQWLLEAYRCRKLRNHTHTHKNTCQRHIDKNRCSKPAQAHYTHTHTHTHTWTLQRHLEAQRGNQLRGPVLYWINELFRQIGTRLMDQVPRLIQSSFKLTMCAPARACPHTSPCLLRCSPSQLGQRGGQTDRQTNKPVRMFPS